MFAICSTAKRLQKIARPNDRMIDVKQAETCALLNRLKYNFINIELDMCEQRKFRPAFASAQSDQRF